MSQIASHILKLMIPLLGLYTCFSCKQSKRPTVSVEADMPWCLEGINELRKGDILVISNGNYWPESSSNTNGIFFGHAALVTEGYQHNNLDSLLANTSIIELMGIDIDSQFQLREVKCNQKSTFIGYLSNSFDNKREGMRYRLRLNIDDQSIDQIIAFARAQKGDEYSWNACKLFLKSGNSVTDNTNWADNDVWNCTLLVWQAVYAITGLDIDSNKGYFVYPNDMINSPLFNNNSKHSGRSRF